ncbi:hypothetical protein LCGC14_2927350, partial [marine sediment metagenome]
MRDLHPTLKHLLRAADPVARIYTEIHDVVQVVTRKTKNDWAEADGWAIANVIATEDGQLKLDPSNITTIDSGAGRDSVNITLLNRASPHEVIQVVWGGSEPLNAPIQQITVYLDPAAGGPKQVTKWFLQVKALVSADSLDTLQLADLHPPVEVAAVGSAGDVVFDLTSYLPQPKAYGPPADATATWPHPTTFIFVWGTNDDGDPVSNLAMGTDAGAGALTASGNVLDGRDLLLIEGLGYTYSSQLDLPDVKIEMGSYTATTVPFTGGNVFDLGAAISTGTVEFVARANIPAGTSVTFQVRNDVDNAWVTYTDGQTTADLAGVTAKQTYGMQV